MTLACGGRGGHRAADYTEDLADAGGNARHDRPGRDRNESSSHEGIFNQVLTVLVFPHLRVVR